MEKFMSDKKFSVIGYKKNLNTSDIFRFLLELDSSFHGIRHFLNYKNQTIIDTFDRSVIDIIEIPESIDVYLNKVDIHDDTAWQKVYVKYLPLCILPYVWIELKSNKQDINITVYTLDNDCKNELIKMNLIEEGNILYKYGSYELKSE
jgi:hypothetical protein